MEGTMRKYQRGRDKKLIEIVCNCCGKKLTFTDGMLTEDVCKINVEWGYFSKKDGEIHSLDLCEECYDKIIQDFAVPPEIESRIEIF